jgi:uncharacterized membrane protein
VSQRTVHFVNLGAQRSRAAWTAVARRSPIEQILLGLLLLIVALPIFLILLGLAVFFAALAITMFIFAFVRSRILRLFGREQTDKLRENVRVIGSNERA